MLDYHSVRTYRDLLRALQQANEEQLDMPIQCTDSHPVDEYVYVLKQAICLGTVNEIDLRYARSVKDNRRNGDELVLFCDGNPFAEDGAISYVMQESPDSCEESASPLDLRDRFQAVYQEDHDDSCDWTGPAQRIADQQLREAGRGTLREILSHRSQRTN